MRHEYIHPRVQAAEQQRELEAGMPRMQHLVDMANLKLGFTSITTMTEASEAAEPLIEQLNYEWPFMNHVFAIRGQWYGKKYDFSDVDNAIYMSDIEVQSALCAAPSNGFGVSRKANGDYFVGPSFIVGSITNLGPHENVSFDVIKVADVREVELQYVSSPNESREALGKLAKPTLKAYDKLYREMVSDDIGFYAQDHTGQKQLVSDIIDEANAALTAPLVTVSTIMQQVSGAYFRSTASVDGYTKLEPIRNRKTFSLHGVLLGVTILDVDVLDQKRLTGKQDLIDVDAGICAVVDPVNSRVGNHVNSGNILVPVQNIGRLAFYSF